MGLQWASAAKPVACTSIEVHAGIVAAIWGHGAMRRHRSVLRGASELLQAPWPHFQMLKEAERRGRVPEEATMPVQGPCRANAGVQKARQQLCNLYEVDVRRRYACEQANGDGGRGGLWWRAAPVLWLPGGRRTYGAAAAVFWDGLHFVLRSTRHAVASWASSGLSAWGNGEGKYGGRPSFAADLSGRYLTSRPGEESLRCPWRSGEVGSKERHLEERRSSQRRLCQWWGAWTSSGVPRTASARLHVAVGAWPRS